VSAALPAMDVGSRLDRLRSEFDGAGVDALLVTRLPNVRYLTGFTGSAGILLVTTADALFVTDGRYRDQASEQLGAAGVAARVAIGATQADQREALSAAVADAGVGRLGLEAQGITWAQQRTFAEEWFPDIELLATTDVVEGLRRVKDDGEVARIEAACAIADDTLAALLPTLADGPTELEFAIALEFGMRERGASGNSFDPIVASGPNGAKPHARPSERAIGRGELVVLDFGCIVDGYCSDMTRTVSVGDPGPDARHLYEVVLESQAAGSAAVAPGAVCSDVDRASRDVIEAAGWGDAFLHGTGHGVGIEIHEAPRVGSTSGDTLASGAVVTVEPGVYLTGIGGVRIEDTLVVTAPGNGRNGAGSRVLTNSPKDLVL
jgi:Xaa-Pro aminopeptidase